MKVLHLLNTNAFSGAENVVCQIISMFKEDNDIEMSYCSIDGPIRYALIDRDINFVPIRKMSKSELTRVIREYKPDVIHAHDMRASFFAALACRKTPFISHIHNNAFDARGSSAKTLSYVLAAQKAKRIFWVSQSSFDGYKFHAFFENKSVILYNIIDIDSLYQKMDKDKNSYNYDVIYLGRLSPEKNPNRLLDVCSLLANKKEDIRIAVVGTGQLENDIKERAKQLGLLKNIDFLGFQNNPLKILYDSKVMIMTSLWEGTPMCALEAAALGIPIVSTPVDGLKDLITNDVNGYMSDDNSVMAEKVIEYITDDEMLTTLSNNQIEKSKEWNDKAKYYRTLKDAYLRCLL